MNLATRALVVERFRPGRALIPASCWLPAAGYCLPRGRRRERPGTDVSVDRDGRLHVAALKAIPEPPSLTDLRKRVEAMLPQVDLAEVILEMMSWEPGFTPALTSITGGRAGLAAHAMSIGFAPVISRGVPVLERDRIATSTTPTCARRTTPRRTRS